MLDKIFFVFGVVVSSALSLLAFCMFFAGADAFLLSLLIASPLAVFSWGVTVNGLDGFEF